MSQMIGSLCNQCGRPVLRPWLPVQPGSDPGIVEMWGMDQQMEYSLCCSFSPQISVVLILGSGWLRSVNKL